MRTLSIVLFVLLVGIAVGLDRLGPPETPAPRDTTVIGSADTHRIANCQPGFFVPNLGQWDHPARFVHDSGPMSLFAEDRGWVIDVVERQDPWHDRVPSVESGKKEARGVAVRMTFDGDPRVPRIVGENELPGHHNYFLGSDPNRWRTDVPLFASIRYERLYPGIDLRLRENQGVPEYDLLLQPGADLLTVSVQVDGGRGLSLATDGSLVIETELGTITQPKPKTWQVDRHGTKREVRCEFKLLGPDRFGFEAPAWAGDTHLTIDPGLIWSTFLGGTAGDDIMGIGVDATGVTVVAGTTHSSDFPTTTGGYDTTFNGSTDVFISALDPRQTGVAQLLYSTFVGGRIDDIANGMFLEDTGVITVAGVTASNDFPTTPGAFDRSFNGKGHAFVCRVDVRKSGAAQLSYSTYLGGSGVDGALAVAVDVRDQVTVTGWLASTDFPFTRNAFDTSHNGLTDVYVTRLDPSKTGSAQLVFSTYLGGSRGDHVKGLYVDLLGVVTVAGMTQSKNFPTMTGAFDTNHSGGNDVFITRLDPSKTGAAQLVYSTFLGNGTAGASALDVDAFGVMTVAGSTTGSTGIPTTKGAFDTSHDWGNDAFVSRLDPRKKGAAQLVYSTYLGSSNHDYANAVSVDTAGVVTVAGSTWSPGFPTTSGAFDTIHNGREDVFISRLDPRKTGAAQLTYSTFLGGSGFNPDRLRRAMCVDASGVATVAGITDSTNFPTTVGAYDRSHNGPRLHGDGFISRIDMGVALYGDTHAVSIRAGGTQRLTVNAGRAHANRLYWIFGSMTGTSPGVNLLGVHIPLNADAYTDLAMSSINTSFFTSFKGTLDGNGRATAALNIPPNLPVATGFEVQHAYVVYDSSGTVHMASNPVPLRLR